MPRRLLLLFLACWLPLQSGIALASCLAASALSQPAQVLSGHEHAAAAAETAHAGHGQIGAALDDGGDCERCNLCQFVHGGAVLQATTLLPAVVPASLYLTSASERFTARIPETPQRPPLSAA
ncbi:MAG TPA: hypothetical protein PKC23_08655 [Candidatus Desulfobacillus sp.]|nr:hypothetical protein [Candidatus Desulfobacillus sp.]